MKILLDAERSAFEQQGKPTKNDNDNDKRDNLWVLILSNDGSQWPEDRCSAGDLALGRAFGALSSCTTTVTLLTDATAAVARSKLEDILRQMEHHQQTAPATLVVYFGGHGKPGRFCMNAAEEETDDSSLCYSDVVDLLNEHLQPQHCAWLLLDCCYSGSFLDQFNCNGNNNNNSNACVIASTAPDQEAGPDWTLTETWLAAMRGTLPPSLPPLNHGDGSDIGSSDDSDKTASTASFNHHQQQQQQEPHQCTIWHVLEWMRFEIKRVKDDDMCHLIINSSSSSTNEQRCTIDLDDVFPFQLPANTSAATTRSNTPTASVRSLPTFELQRVQCHLAEQGLFRSYERPPGSRFLGLWLSDVDDDDDDDAAVTQQLYRGVVLSDDDIPWQDYWEEQEGLSDASGTVGPFVPVRWIDEGTYSLIPLCHCYFLDYEEDYEDVESAISVDELRSRAERAAFQELQRFVAPPLSMLTATTGSFVDYRIEMMLRSMETARKRLRLPSFSVAQQGEIDLRRTKTRPVECWDDHDRTWVPASLVPLQHSSVEVLAMHLDHSETGDYCIVEAGGFQNCLPIVSHVREAGD